MTRRAKWVHEAGCGSNTSESCTCSGPLAMTPRHPAYRQQECSSWPTEVEPGEYIDVTDDNAQTEADR